MSRLDLFNYKNGIMPACDVDTIEKFEEIVKNTHSVEGIVGYKIGFVLGLTFGLSKCQNMVEKYTDLPLIYDHQKAGTDIPQMGDNFAKVCKKAGVKGVIIFPQAGPITEKSFIESLNKNQLTPIVGGEMTHQGYLQDEGGFIRNDAPEEMYKIGAESGAEYFVVPGNRTQKIEKYRLMLSDIIEEPKFCFPGIGRQGGDIAKAFEATGGFPAYAIIGSGIYKQKDMEEAARRYCKEALR